MILNIRGMNGSGKSFIAKELLRLYPHERILNPKGKVIAYKLTPFKTPLYIIGSYPVDKIHGGADVLGKVEVTKALVEQFYPLGDVLFESFMLSTSVKTWGREAIVKYGDDWVFLFLDTPIELCLQRTLDRKLNPERINRSNFTAVFNYIQTWYKKIQNLGGNCVMLDHTRSVQHILDILLPTDK